MSKQAQDILDSIKNDPTNWTYRHGRLRRADGVLSVYVRSALLFPKVKVFGNDPFRAWVENEYELPATLWQRYQFKRLDLRAGTQAFLRSREEEAARNRVAIQQLIDQRPPIEVNPPAAQRTAGGAVLGMLNPGFNHPILQAAMQNVPWPDNNNQAAAQQGQQVVI